MVLEVLDNLLRLLSDVGTGEAEVCVGKRKGRASASQRSQSPTAQAREKQELTLVDLGVRSRGSEALEAELLVRVAVPAEHVVGLDGEDGVARRKDRELVLLGLGLEHEPAGERDDSRLDAGLGEDLGGLDSDGNLGSGRDEGDVGIGLLVDDVSSLDTVLDLEGVTSREESQSKREEGEGNRKGRRTVEFSSWGRFCRERARTEGVDLDLRATR